MVRSAFCSLVLVALVWSAAARAADPNDPKIRINAVDQRRASAAALTQGDLGLGWVGGPIKPTSMKAPVCPAFNPSRADLTVTGHAESLFNNGNGGFQVGSDTEVMKTPAQVLAIFNRIVQPQLARCVRYDLSKSLGGTGIELGAARRIAFPKLAAVTVVYRVIITLKSAGRTVHVIDDVVMLGEGRTAYFMNFIAPATEQAQLRRFEQRLARTILKRAVM